MTAALGALDAVRHPGPSDPPPRTAAQTGRPCNCSTHAHLALHGQGSDGLMPDYRIDETAPEHRKLRAAGLAAAGLWAMAGAYSMREGTDGWVPGYWVGTWPSGKRYAGVLVKVGLWQAERRDNLDGYRFHDWLHYQRSAEQIAGEKHANAVRRELYASPQLIAAIKQRDGDHCRYCAREVSWTNRRGSAGATFDHVVPMDQGGGNTLENVVVACRGCNSGKRSRTPEQAGIRLLPPAGDLVSELDPNKVPFESGPEPNQQKTVVPVPVPSFGAVEGVGNVSRRARSNEPPNRCPKHEGQPDDDRPCRACGDARRGYEAWQADQRRLDAERQAAENRQQAEARALAIVSCPMCDDRGYVGIRLCDHDPTAADRAARGRAGVDAVLARSRNGGHL